ncbi:10715_t:CDS:2 [Acaulospora morrowiae]|uniref:10715_t:CDS:1 n=1 Tax=Acaulospora morrowiae TaxID=94023 RepID=A0A9N9GIY2_9GLOM|nr:10715_t:CDS:2 [Acaulospora morrowiae]
MTIEDIQKYITLEWVSEDFLSGDLKPSNLQQSSVYTDPLFTFQEKFLEKRWQRLVVRELLNEKLLPQNSKLYEGNFNGNKKSLPPQSIQPIPTSSEIPTNFMELLESEVFNHTSLDHASHNNPSALVESSDKLLWKNFALWGCFVIGPNFIQQLRRHCRHLWFRVNLIYRHVESQDKSLERYIHETFLRHPRDKLYIAKESTMIVARGINLKNYQHIFNPQCFVNTFGETIVDLFDFYNKIAVEDVRIAVDQYYQHTLAHPSHQSKQFAKDLIEHFGGFADSNNLPYTTANTASSHCEEHQECVQDLIQGLQPISKAVNKYIEATYPALYSKMKKLDLGPNVPKSFGVFPTVAVNFNVICQFHRDLKDHRNTLCVVCPLGKFEGGELTFPELKLIIHAKQGQAVAFRSNILVHGNLPVIAGVRHSVVFYIHNTIIKQKRKFGSLFADYDLGWDNNSNEDEPLPKYLPPTLGSGDNEVKPKNHRRTNIDLERARKGLPARYKK